MRITVNYFLGSIKNGSVGDFVNAIENMTAEQVESLTVMFLSEYKETEDLYFNRTGSKLEPSESFVKWAFENLPYDTRSVNNQSILQKLIARDVYCNQSSLVDCLPYEDLERENDSFYRVDLSTGEEELSYDEKEEMLTEKREELEQHEENEPKEPDYFEDEEGNADEWSDLHDAWIESNEEWEDKKEALENDIEALEYADVEHCDIYEHWVVSSWLESKLEEYGQVIVKHTQSGETWWGRCTTGQAILLDYVIGQIAFDMEILEFQKYQW